MENVYSYGKTRLNVKQKETSFHRFQTEGEEIEFNKIA